MVSVMLLSALPLSPASPGPVTDGPEVDIGCPPGDVGPSGATHGSPVEGEFTQNLGQWEDHVMFMADSPFGHAAFGNSAVTYIVLGEQVGCQVRISFGTQLGVAPTGVGELGHTSSYFLGNDPEGWVAGARSYRELLYEDAWPGVDIRYYFSDGDLKYDIVLDERADPAPVRFRIEGHEGLDVREDALDLRLPNGLSLRDGGLVATYEDGEAVGVSFDVDPDGAGFGFDLKKQEGRKIVVDPIVMSASTFFGGTYNDKASDVVVDVDGNIYITGETMSTDFPTSVGAFDLACNDTDLFVTKLNHNCSEVIYSTFIGGKGNDLMGGIELDANGNAYIGGTTYSSTFPVTSKAFQRKFNNGLNDHQMDFYVAKIGTNGTRLVFSTYLGGSGPETFGDLEVHDNMVMLSGRTDSYDFPSEDGTYGACHGDAIFVVLNKDGDKLVDTRFWGGSGSEIATAIATDPSGDIVVAGWTTSMDFQTTSGAYQTLRPCFVSGYVTKFRVGSDPPDFSTYLGGGYNDGVTGVTVDGGGNIYLTGTTLAFGSVGGYPTTPGCFDDEYNGRSDGYITKMDPNGTRLIYSTYLGGDLDDYPRDIVVDEDGRAVVVGQTRDGTNFTVTRGCHDDLFEGANEGFIFILDENGTKPVYSSFLGGSFADDVTGVAITELDDLVLTGFTESGDLTVSEGAVQPRIGGNSDAFVSIIGVLSPPSEPLDLVATGGEGYIHLEWEMPLHDGDYTITHYIVHRGLEEDNLTLLTMVPNINHLIDDRVAWGEYYHYTVSATNGKGVSEPSNVATNRSVTVPDAPPGINGTVHLDHITLEWEGPAFTGGLPLLAYRLYRRSPSGGPGLLSTISFPLEGYVDVDLEDRTTYTYDLAAVNSFGESRQRATVTLNTTGVPTPPLNIDHTYGDRFIRLTWETPEDLHGLPVIRYNVYRHGGIGPGELVGSVPSPIRWFVDGDVEFGTTYTYTVTAENAKGISTRSDPMEAKVRVRPHPPRGVEAVSHEQFVKVTWDAPTFDGASPITDYRVYLGTDVDDRLYIGGISVVGRTDADLVFLHPVPYDGVPRHYWVTAVNDEGESDRSPMASTQVFAVPDPPGNLTLVRGDGELVLTWTSPMSDGGTPVLAYVVSRMTGGGTMVPLVSLASGNQGYVDVDLVNGLEYTYRVTVVNLVGESEPCPPVSAVPAGVPDAPEDLVATGGVGTVHLAWNAPSRDGGHPVSGYLVYRMREGGSMELLAELGPQTLEMVDSGVAVAVVHMYAIVAVTDAGVSGQSEVASAMAYGPPGAPLGLVAVWMGGHLQLTWSSPLDDGGNGIIGYYLHRYDRADGNVTDLAATDLTFLVHDLEIGKTYEYTVSAYNGAGEGPGRSVTFTVPLPEPEPPEISSTSPWMLLAIVVVLVAIVGALLAMMGRRKDPDMPMLFA